jgi:hypothetical protein
MPFSFEISQKTRTLKNFFALVFAFFLTFSAKNCITGIQSVVNGNDNLGLAQLCVGFSTQFLTSLVLPLVIIKTIGFKWSMAISQILYTLLVGMTTYPRWYTMIPAAIGVGLGSF